MIDFTAVVATILNQKHWMAVPVCIEIDYVAYSTVKKRWSNCVCKQLFCFNLLAESPRPPHLRITSYEYTIYIYWYWLVHSRKCDLIFLSTVKIESTENVTQDQNQSSLVESDLDEKAKTTNSILNCFLRLNISAWFKIITNTADMTGKVQQATGLDACWIVDDYELLIATVTEFIRTGLSMHYRGCEL